MKFAFLPVCVIFIACGSTGPTTTPDGARDGPPSAELSVPRVSRDGDQGAFALELSGPTPGELGEAARAGRVWLALERPRGFSFAGFALLAGDSVFEPRSAEVVYARALGRRRRDPGLLRLRGTIAADAGAARVARIPDAAMTVAGLGSYASDDLRPLLGQGVSNMMAMTAARDGGAGEYDTYGWVGVFDGDGKAVPWARIDEAVTRKDLAPLAAYHVVVRRWRPGAEVRALFFKVALQDVVAASQMKLTPARGGFEWIWEGVWVADFAVPPDVVNAPAWPTASTLRVRYSEYTPKRLSSNRGITRTLLAPLALGADIGSSLFQETFDDSDDGAGTYERVREKRASR